MLGDALSINYCIGLFVGISLYRELCKKPPPTLTLAVQKEKTAFIRGP